MTQSSRWASLGLFGSLYERRLHQKDPILLVFPFTLHNSSKNSLTEETTFGFLISSKHSTICHAKRAAINLSNIREKPIHSPCLVVQRPPRIRSKDVFPVPVFPVINRLFPCVILRFRSLISSFSEGAETEMSSRRKAVSLETILSLETLKGLNPMKREGERNIKGKTRRKNRVFSPSQPQFVQMLWLEFRKFTF